MISRLFLAAIAVFSSLTHANLVTLGPLTDYTMAAAGNGWSGGNVILGSSAHIYGSVAASAYLGLGAGVKIDGDACSGFVGAGPTEMKNIGGLKGPCGNFSQLYAAVTDLSQSLAQPGQTLGNLTGGRLFSPGVYNIDHLLLQSNDTLTLRGGTGQKVILNVYGHAQFGSGAAVKLEGGLRPEDVFFNFVKSDQYRSFEFGGAALAGTFVSNGRDFIMGDGATLTSTRFYTSGNMIANVQDVRFDNAVSPPVKLPDDEKDVADVASPPSPSSLAMLFMMLASAFVCTKIVNAKTRQQ